MPAAIGAAGARSRKNTPRCELAGRPLRSQPAIAWPTSPGSGSRSARPPLPHTTSSPTCQSMSSSLSAATLCRRRHNHDLRHTGNMLTATTGATLRELMDRMGHSTTRAALIFLHGSDARQREIAGALSHLAEQQIAALPGTANGNNRQGNGHVTGTTA